MAPSMQEVDAAFDRQLDREVEEHYREAGAHPGGDDDVDEEEELEEEEEDADDFSDDSDEDDEDNEDADDE